MSGYYSFIMKRDKLLLPFFSLLLFFSCTQEKYYTTEWEPTTVNYSLVKSKTVMLKIDSITNRYNNIPSYSRKERLLSLYNVLNHSLDFFDLESSEMIKRFTLEKSGPNSILPLNSLVFHSFDSIYGFSDQNKTLYLFNSSSEIIKKIKLFEDSDPSNPILTDLTVKDNLIMMSVLGYRSTSKNLLTKSLFIYDLNTNKKEFHVDAPEEYVYNNWADKGALRNGVYIPNKKTFVVSYSMGNKMKAFNLQDKSTSTVNFNATYYSKPDPFDEKVNSIESRIKYSLVNNWYDGLYFYEEEGFILRSLSLAKKINEDSNFSLNNLNLPPNNPQSILSIIEIFDSDLNKIGEVNNMKFYKEIFSNEDGVYLADWEIDQSNEDIIAYSLYTIKKTNNEFPH